MNNTNSRGDGVKYFLIGGAVGAIAMLFFVPRSGKEMRKLCANGVRRGKDSVEGGLKKGKDKLFQEKQRIETEARELLDKAVNLTKHEKDKILDAVGAGKSVY